MSHIGRAPPLAWAGGPCGPSPGAPGGRCQSLSEALSECPTEAMDVKAEAVFILLNFLWELLVLNQDATHGGIEALSCNETSASCRLIMLLVQVALGPGDCRPPGT